MLILSEGRQLKFVRSVDSENSWETNFNKADARFDDRRFFYFAVTTIITVKIATETTGTSRDICFKTSL